MTNLPQVLNECLSKGIPFVCFRQAGQKLRAFTGDILEIDPDSLVKRNLPAGFLFAPFDLHHQKAYFLTENHSLITSDSITGIPCIENQPDAANPFLPASLHSTDFNEYAAEFDSFMNLIQDHKLQKAVASRRTLVPALDTENYVVLLNELAETYPNAFVYWIFLPGICSWMGASPETLLSGNGTSAETMSLAGTRHPEQTDFQFGDKERTEQGLVSTSIEKTLHKYATEILIEGPSEITAGRLKHLQTRYTFDLNHKDFLPLAIDLHPTPAVGGVPKNDAWNSILRIEKQPRNFYCGFMGYLHPTSGGSLFVNLRCMEIFSDYLCLYSGGGITKDSVLEEEWKETGYKNETLLSVIEKIRKFGQK